MEDEHSPNNRAYRAAVSIQSLKPTFILLCLQFGHSCLSPDLKLASTVMGVAATTLLWLGTHEDEGVRALTGEALLVGHAAWVGALGHATTQGGVGALPPPRPVHRLYVVVVTSARRQVDTIRSQIPRMPHARVSYLLGATRPLPRG